jgi:hypothetical protein
MALALLLISASAAVLEAVYGGQTAPVFWRFP